MIGAILSNRYELVAIQFEGPIFTPFLGRDTTSGKEVCIRLFRNPFDQELDFVAAVGAAGRKAGSISHPAIERIDGVEYDSGRPFLVGQFSPGITLADRIRKLAPFSVPVAVGTAISMLEGLEALHAAGIVHGDVSADNVIIGMDGSARLQLAAIWESYSRSATAGAVVLPSLAPFLAPEVSAGGAPSPASDVYSVGVLLFELLCGRPPYSADSPLAMAIKHATAPTPSVKGFNASAPVVLDEIVKKAMNKDPVFRYHQAGPMLSDLRTLQDALRFGRTLTWPIKQAAVEMAAEPVAVAPRMSAAREKPARQSNRKPNVDSGDDVPRWLNTAAIVLVSIVGGIIIMWLWVNTSKPKFIKVPSLKGMDIAQARSRLRALHLELRPGQREPNERLPADSIISSDPDTGESVREGSSVTVMLSAGSKMVEVPNVVGYEVDRAIAALHQVDLNVEQPVDHVDSNAPRDQVVDETPSAQSKVERESGIRLKVSNGTPPSDGSSGATTTPSEDPADVPSEYTLKIKLTDAEMAVGVRVEIEDSHGPRDVHNETHEAGETFSVDATGYGPKATFRIYYDGELKKTVTESARPPRTRRTRA